MNTETIPGTVAYISQSVHVLTETYYVDFLVTYCIY
jgi:hypothetical protein